MMARKQIRLMSLEFFYVRCWPEKSRCSCHRWHDSISLMKVLIGIITRNRATHLSESWNLPMRRPGA